MILPMIVPLAFWSLILCAIAIGLHAGDRRDFGILVSIVLAALLTFIIRATLVFPLENFLVVIVNVALLMIIWRFAMRSERHWPIWFAGMHAAACFLGLVALLLPAGGHRALLEMVAAFWSIPALAVLAIGVMLDQKAAPRG